MARYSKSAKSYVDVHQTFVAAGQTGTITLEFETPAEAVTWGGRANAYRVLLRNQNADAGREFASEFDHLVVSHPKGSNIVTIRPRGFNFIARKEDGTPIDLNKQTIEGPVPTPYERSVAEAEADAFLESYEAEQGTKK